MKKILLAGILLFGINLSLNANEIEDMANACNEGSAKQCMFLGVKYRDWGDSYSEEAKEFYGKAKVLYRSACNNGDAESCMTLGVIYRVGGGKKVKQDFVKAVEVYRKACDIGLANGCSNLGYMYETGQGVKQSNLKAKEFYYKGCEGKNTEACEEYAKLNKK